MNRILIFVLAFVVCSFGYGQGLVDSARLVSKSDSSSHAANNGWLSVHSEPEGAEIYDGSKFIGVTPVDSLSVDGGIHVLRLFYPNVRYWNSVTAADTLTVIPTQNIKRVIRFGDFVGHRNFNNIAESPEKEPNVFLASADGKDDKAWVGYTAAATMIVSGAVSAYLKTNSDHDFDAYVANRDPNLLSRVHRLDTWAGVSLFVSEISFGVLTYFLLVD